VKLGIIAGNRYLPLLLTHTIKEKSRDIYVVAICFKGETSLRISKYVDKTYWVKVGSLGKLREIIKKEGLKEMIMVGQISPLRIFKRKGWDRELFSLVEKSEDFRPHIIFNNIIDYLSKEGVVFLDSTLYLNDYLAEEGVMNSLSLDNNLQKEIEFGIKIISRFVDLDVGQTIAVKRGSVVALESIEGTDRTILRAYRLTKGGCTVLKFSKNHQDLRFDVPVVGISTLKLLKKAKVSALVLEKGKVIILEKEKFLSLAKLWRIPVIGKGKFVS
jgi:hypothetical protein